MERKVAESLYNTLQIYLGYRVLAHNKMQENISVTVPEYTIEQTADNRGHENPLSDRKLGPLNS